MKKPLILVLTMLVIASLACSLNINIPRLQTGPTQTFNVNEPLGDTNNELNLSFAMGAGSLKLSGGASDLIDGTIKYNVPSWEPTISKSSSSLTIKQPEATNINGIPTDNIVNEWDMRLNGSQVYNLNIVAGAYKGDLDLSGLHIRNLDISDGASETRVLFNVDNPETLDQFTYKTGASKVTMYGLAHANFKNMLFESGAGTYTLDFGGTLRQDANVTVKSGFSDLSIIIPIGMKATIVNAGKISNISTTGKWTVDNNAYQTDGDGPVVTIQVEMAVGNLQLIHQ